VRHTARFALRGALSGLLCCSPGLLMAFSHLGASTGAFLWQLIFIWWAPGATYGALVAAPLSLACKRSPVDAAVAFVASVGGYLVAILMSPDWIMKWLPAWGWLGLSIRGALGALIVAFGVLPSHHLRPLLVILLTAVAGGLCAPGFDIRPSGGTADQQSLVTMIHFTVAFVVWQSVTAVCLSLALVGRLSGQSSKGGAATDAKEFGPEELF
jgi:hypothetical protein